MNENTKVARAAWVIGSATFLSRVFGYLRDVVIACLFGAGMAADAFIVAFRIPNLLRRLFGEGTLTVSFIPVFTDYRACRSEEEARKLADVTFTLLGLILLVVTALGIWLSPWIIRLLASGFSDQPGKFELAVLLNRIMFPYVFFICLVALFMGVLNTLRHFFAPAFSPVILNVVMIAFALGLSRFFEIPIVALAVGVVVAGLLQLLFQLPFLKRRGHLPRLNFGFNHPAVKRIGLLMIPAVVGLAVYNLNVLVNTHLASLFSDGAVSYLYFADRLMELPLGVFAIAFGTAILPTMAMQATQKRHEELKGTLSFALRMVFYVILPASVGLIALRVPIVNLLFQRGEFGLEATQGTADALMYYCLGLWAFSAVRIVVPTYYALKDFWTPVKVAMLALAVNLTAAFCFIGPVDSARWPLVSHLSETMNLFGPMRHAGLALATSLASAVQVIFLIWILKRRLGRFGARRIAGSVLRSAAGAAVMGFVVHGIQGCFDWTATGLTAAKVGGLFGAIAAGAAVYGGVTLALRSEESGYVLTVLSRRLGRSRNAGD